MEQLNKYKSMVFSYSTAHFFVDFACAFLMFSSVAKDSTWYLSVLLYNFCAFALQMPFGALADAYNRNSRFALGGIVLIAAAFGLTGLPLAAAVVAGLGNGLFHVGGGIDVLNISQNQSSPLGIFVSPGALGLYLGTIQGKLGNLSFFWPLAFLAFSVLLILLSLRSHKGGYLNNSPFSLQRAPSPYGLIAAIFLFLVVCLRSHVGLTLQFPWKGSGYWGLALISGVVLGKVAGGFAADRFGMLKTSVFSMLGAAFLFLLPNVPMAGVLSIFLFNMSMPITLWVMAKIYPGAKGFTFGLLTFGLFIGYLPQYLSLPVSTAPLSFALMAIVSFLLLYGGIRGAKL